jgi:cysteine synthase
MLGGYGHHRIEGTGDNHVPWSVNVKKIDMIVEVDDDLCMRTLRLFNEEAGIRHLTNDVGLDEALAARFSSLGISSIANILSTIKMAKYYECTENDILFTLATDSAELYASRLEEMRIELGAYSDMDAGIDMALSFHGLTLDHIVELSHYDRKRIHNMKYFTWIEQQGKDVEELDEQWHSEKYWRKQWDLKGPMDDLIRAFNAQTGLQPSF